MGKQFIGMIKWGTEVGPWSTMMGDWGIVVEERTIIVKWDHCDET